MKRLDSEATYTRESGESKVYILAYIFYRLRVNFSLDTVAAIDWTVKYDYAALSPFEERSPSESVHWQHHGI